MNTFQFAGKTFKIVEDHISELVEGCGQCAFSDANDLRCAEVDGGTTGRVCCSDGRHHYEEVKKDAHVQ